MIFNRLMIGLGVLAGFALIGMLIMGYVADHWGDMGVAVVVITLFLTFIFLTVGLMFLAFGLGMAHIFGKAIGISPLIELLRTMRAGYSAQKNTLTVLDEQPQQEVTPKALLPWDTQPQTWQANSRAGQLAPISDDDDDEGFTVR